MRLAPILSIGIVMGSLGWAAFVCDGSTSVAMSALAGDVADVPVPSDVLDGSVPSDTLAVPPRGRRPMELESAAGLESEAGSGPTTSTVPTVTADSGAAAPGALAESPRRERRMYDLGAADAPEETLITEAMASMPWSALRAVKSPTCRPRSDRAWIEGSPNELDAWERWLDGRAFAGGRVLSIEFIRLAEPAACLQEFELTPPAAGTSALISARLADAIANAAGRESERIVLDVVEDREVRGSIGGVCAFVEDFDVEVCQDAFISDLFHSTIDSGLEVRAKLGGCDDRGLRVSIQARWGARIPSLETYRTSFLSLTSGPIDASSRVVIEIPKPIEPPSEFAGALTVSNDQGALLGLSHNAVLLVVPRGPHRESARVRTWRRWAEHLTEPTLAPSALPTENFEVTWARIDDAHDASRGSARFERVGDWADDRIISGPSTVDAVRRGLAAPGSAEISPGPKCELRRIDVEVRPSRAFDSRSRTFSFDGTNASAVSPGVSCAVIPLRFMLRMGATSVRDVTLNRGEGLEEWRITITRRPDRGT